jgi:NAD-dependent SIR2 family protein deacetylase
VGALSLQESSSLLLLIVLLGDDRSDRKKVDTLERIAGIPSDKIVEAHGSFATSHCISCHAEMGEQDMRHAVETGGGKPVRCERCGGLVKVSYKSGSSQEVY